MDEVGIQQRRAASARRGVAVLPATAAQHEQAIIEEETRCARALSRRLQDSD